jgi:hypothetical protein
MLNLKHSIVLEQQDQEDLQTLALSQKDIYNQKKNNFFFKTNIISKNTLKIN